MDAERHMHSGLKICLPSESIEYGGLHAPRFGRLDRGGETVRGSGCVAGRGAERSAWRSHRAPVRSGAGLRPEGWTPRRLGCASRRALPDARRAEGATTGALACRDERLPAPAPIAARISVATSAVFRERRRRVSLPALDLRQHLRARCERVAGNPLHPCADLGRADCRRRTPRCRAPARAPFGIASRARARAPSSRISSIFAGEIGSEQARRLHPRDEALVDRLRLGLPRKESLPREELPEHDRRSVRIGQAAHRLAARLLRRHVARTYPSPSCRASRGAVPAALAIPKSTRRVTPSAPTRMFCGDTSRCTMPERRARVRRSPRAPRAGRGACRRGSTAAIGYGHPLVPVLQTRVRASTATRRARSP